MPSLIQKGSTDISRYFMIRDSADGSPETGVTIADLDLQYVRFGAVPVAKVDATALAATDSAHADNKAIEVDGTDQPGLYRVDWPDAAFASGVDGVILTAKGTGFDPAHMEIQLVGFDPTDAVRLGLTTLPNANADAAGGLVISDAGGLDMDTHVISARRAGYALGCVWVNTGIANTNTVSYVDGTLDNPVSTIAAARTIADNLGIKRFHLVPGSSITLGQNFDDFVFDGCHSTIALGGQSVNNTVFRDIVITGNDDGSNASPTQYIRCVIGTNTLGQFVMTECYFLTTLTLAEAGTYRMHWCASGVAGISTPTLDFGSGLNASNVNMRGYSGGITVANMGAGTGSYTMSLEGDGQLIIAASCSATSTIAIRGHFPITDNAGGAVTLSDDGRYDTAQITSAVPTTTAIIDEFETQSQEDPTGFHVNVKEVNDTSQTANDNGADINTLITNVGTPANIDSGGATLSDNIKKLADDNAGADFDATTNSQKAIRDAIAAGAPVLYNPDGSSVINVGNEDAGTFASAAQDDGTKWTIGDLTGGGGSIVAASTLEVVCEFNMGASRIATSLEINGYFDRAGGGGYLVEIYAYDYTQAAWIKLSGGTADTEMRNAAADIDYTFSLGTQYTDPNTAPGEVKIGFVSTRLTTASADVLYLDYVGVTGVASGATSPDAIADAVHIALDEHFQHIPGFTGEIHYVDATADDINSGHTPDTAFATIGAAITASSAGDYIKIKAGTYTEVGINNNKSGLEMHGEIGAIIAPASGSALTISAANCLVEMIEVRPAAGEVGFNLAAGSDYSLLTRVLSTTTGGTGIKIDSSVEHIVVEHSKCSGYTAAGVEINGSQCTIEEVECRGSGGTEVGFKLNHGNAHLNFLNQCSSLDNATYGFQVIAGADDNLFLDCSTSVGDGGTDGRSDAGANNAWRGYKPADIPAAEVTSMDAAALAQFFSVDSGDTYAGSVAGSVVKEIADNAGAVSVLLSTTVATVNSQTSFDLTAGSGDDNAYNNQAAVFYDADNDPSVRKITDYDAANKRIITDSAPDFTVVGTDAVKIFVTAPGTTAPTAAQNADAVWDEALTGHANSGSFGEKVQTGISPHYPNK